MSEECFASGMQYHFYSTSFHFFLLFSLVSELPTADRNSVICHILIKIYTAYIHSIVNYSAEGTFPVSFQNLREAKIVGINIFIRPALYYWRKKPPKNR